MLKLNGKAIDPPGLVGHSRSRPNNPDSLIHQWSNRSQQPFEVCPRHYWPRDHTNNQNHIPQAHRSPNRPHDFHPEVAPKTGRCVSSMDPADSADLPGRNRIDLDMRKHRPSFLEPVDKCTGLSADNSALSDKVGGG